MNTMLLTAALDGRHGQGRIGSRIGLNADAFVFSKTTDMVARVSKHHEKTAINCVLVDEAQFLTDDQVWQLAEMVDELNMRVMCYGLRTDFQGNMFPGSARLLAIADNLREIRTCLLYTSPSPRDS